MLAPLDTRDTAAVRRACEAVWQALTGGADGAFLATAFGWVEDTFTRGSADFEPLDTRYHDLEHTLQGTLCLARLLSGWQRAPGTPPLTPRAIRLGLVAILLHDTGYLKHRGDHLGTGAKFTPIHVQRSADVAGAWLPAQGFSAADIGEIQSMIRCTGVAARVSALQFENDLHRRVGCALASADLLGQMAAADYPERLPALFEEFAEAAARPDPAVPVPPGALPNYANATELIAGTLGFWKSHVWPRLEGEYEGVYRYLNDPWPDGPNDYVARVEANLQRIQQFLAARR